MSPSGACGLPTLTLMNQTSRRSSNLCSIRLKWDVPRVTAARQQGALSSSAGRGRVGGIDEDRPGPRFGT